MSNPESSIAILGQTDFSELYPTATPQELDDAWLSYYADNATAITQPNLVLGSLQKPQDAPSLFVSVDLCEVVRDTHISIRGFEELPGTNAHKEPYGYDMKMLGVLNNRDQKVQQVIDMARVLINADLIQPDAHISSTRAFLQSSRNQGAYVFANTATSEGCEIGTVRFLGTYLPDCFDGIVFSRNYDSSGPIRKGTVAREVVDMFGADIPTSVVHIDDSTRHLTSFRESFGDRPNTAIKTIQARYEHVDFDPESDGSYSRIGTFAVANAYIQAELTRLS